MTLAFCQTFLVRTRFTVTGVILGSSIKVEVIGRVKNDVQEGGVDNWSEVVSEIVLEEEFEALLDGIEAFSHITVVFWMDKAEGYQPKVHPRGREDIPKQGVFATRTPSRPNPIGVSSVELLHRKKNSLTVSGLDCFNGTPVLDIKPYTPKNREITDIRIPGWMEDLFRENRNP